MTSLPFPSRHPVPDPAMIAHMRAGLLLAIDTFAVADWAEMIGLAVIDYGGSLVLPDAQNTWASHMAELSLIGITGRGDDLEAAVRDWAKAAGRTLGVGEAA